MLLQKTFKEDRNDDRILVLKVKDGEKPKSSTGLVDPRLFTGENKLHLKRNKTLWEFKYDQGGVPPQLKDRFTKFDLALAHAKKYLDSRNIEVVQVID